MPVERRSLRLEPAIREPIVHGKRLLVALAVALLPSIRQPQQPIKTYDGNLDWVYWNMDFLGDLDGYTKLWPVQVT